MMGWGTPPPPPDPTICQTCSSAAHGPVKLGAGPCPQCAGAREREAAGRAKLAHEGSRDNFLPNPDGGDHDTPYRFGRRPSVRAPFPFTERQLARLLVMRARLAHRVEQGQTGDKE